MIQVTPQMRVLVALEPADFRCGIDGLARLCKARLQQDPFSGTVFVFRNRRRTAIKALVYDGQGFWLCHKRLSSGKFRWWPRRADEAVTTHGKIREEEPEGDNVRVHCDVWVEKDDGTRVALGSASALGD